MSISDAFFLWAVVVPSGLALATTAVMAGSLAPGFTWDPLSIAMGLLRAVFGIFLGLLLYPIHVRSARLPSVASAWFAVAVIMAALVSPTAGVLDPMIDLLTVFLLFPMTILAAARVSETRFARPLLLLGSISYPMYVLHKPIADILRQIAPDPIAAYAPVSGIALIVLVSGLSLAAERWYDIPCAPY